MSKNFDLNELNDMFKVKVEHKIYSFYTNTTPNFMKIGDTYRQVAIRLKEWKRVYKNLTPEQIFDANINQESFFRDLSVHQYLRIDKNKHVVVPDDVKGITEYCTELFTNDVSTSDVEDAIHDIKDNYGAVNPKYVYYKLDGKGTTDGVVKWSENYPMRPNQEKTVENFVKAVANGRNNLLMYAVMRFGKSFTAMQCAKAYAQNHPLKVIVITSAKKDVENEWKNTINSHCDFRNFEFVTDNDLAEDYNKIKKITNDGKIAVVFLTLQVLNKHKPDKRHEQVFEAEIDLLFIDETHYGARAKKLGKILECEDCDSNEVAWEDVARDTQKVKEKLHAKVNLHLSGTPYNILKTEEFSKEDIIAFYQFSDIANEKESWQKKFDANKEEFASKEAWDNPYFGFPQMIRFAFNLSEESVSYINSTFKDGRQYFTELFQTKSDDVGCNVFVHENDVLKLFKTIDGSQEGSELLAFLEYEGIKAADICRHIVCVLPRRASCDALEKLLKDHSAEFKNLKDYEIINISGFDSEYNGTDYTNRVKAKISECEKRNQKTFSVTVNKMLTGTTVKEWDSMLYFKDTLSAQEYDQAVYRIQNPYVEKSVGVKDGKEYVIKIDKKPQTLLVDFDPARMFYMQATNIDKLSVINPNNEIIDFSQKAKSDLTISPIICLNKNKLQKIDEDTIVETIVNYTKDRSVVEETVDMVISDAFLTDRNLCGILNHYPMLDAKTGIKHNPNSRGERKDFQKSSETNVSDADSTAMQGDTDNFFSSAGQEQEDNLSAIRKRFNAFIAKLLFFVFLSGEKCSNIEDVINALDRTETNKRMARNLGVNKTELTVLNRFAKGYDKNYIVKSIVKMSTLANDSTLSASEKARTAINKFSRFSEAEIVTPEHVCYDMLNCIGQDKLAEIVSGGGKILDIAGKSGEFAYAIYNLLHGKVDEVKLKNAICSIPTSKEAYEFTRHVYENVGLNVANIAEKFVAFDLLDVKNGKKQIDYDKIRLLLTQDKPFNTITLQDEVQEGENKVKFDAVVGNPPYQEEGGSGGSNDAPIYQFFAIAAEKIKPYFVSLIMPARWFAAGRENLLGSFRKHMIKTKQLNKMVVFANSADVFSNVEIKGGICYYLLNSSYSGDCDYVLHEGDSIIKCSRELSQFDIVIRNPKLADIVAKVRENSVEENCVDSIVSNDTPFGISSNPKSSKKNPMQVYEVSTSQHNTKLYHIQKLTRKIEYVDRSLIKKNERYIDSVKVLIPGASGTGNDPYVLGKPICAPRNSVCSQSFLFVPFNDNTEAENFLKYVKSKFFRILVSAVKISQSAPKRVYKFVPLQDFTENSDIDWSKSVAEIDQQLYKKYNLTDEEITFIESMIKPME